MDWIDLAPCRDRWQELVNAVMFHGVSSLLFSDRLGVYHFGGLSPSDFMFSLKFGGNVDSASG
jgi:hypothetical protein